MPLEESSTNDKDSSEAPMGRICSGNYIVDRILETANHEPLNRKCSVGGKSTSRMIHFAI